MPQQPQAPFISSTEAAKRFNLTNDHIGLLCRRGKVEGALLGRLWYVNESSLAAYVQKNAEVQEARRKSLSKQWTAAWTAALLAFALFTASGIRADAQVPRGAELRIEHRAIVQVTEAERADASVEKGEPQAEQHAPMPAMQLAAVAEAQEPASHRRELGFMTQVGEGVLAIGDTLREFVPAAQKRPQTFHITYAKKVSGDSFAAQPEDVLAAAVVAARSYSIAAPALQPPQAAPAELPQVQRQATLDPALIQKIESANQILGAMNDNMFGLYADALRQFGASAALDTNAALYVADKTFGEFGRRFVSDTYAARDAQVHLYASAAAVLQAQYDRTASAIDETPTFDCSLSVASAGAGGGDITLDSFMQNSGLASVWDAYVQYLANTFFIPKDVAAAIGAPVPPVTHASAYILRSADLTFGRGAGMQAAMSASPKGL